MDGCPSCFIQVQNYTVWSTNRCCGITVFIVYHIHVGTICSWVCTNAVSVCYQMVHVVWQLPICWRKGRQVKILLFSLISYETISKYTDLDCWTYCQRSFPFLISISRPCYLSDCYSIIIMWVELLYYLTQPKNLFVTIYISSSNLDPYSLMFYV